MSEWANMANYIVELDRATHTENGNASLFLHFYTLVLHGGIRNHHKVSKLHNTISSLAIGHLSTCY